MAKTTRHGDVTFVLKRDPECIHEHKAIVIWMTGLSGSGKSTTAKALENRLHSAGYYSTILDGDELRRGLNKDLGFSPESRSENIRRIAEVAAMMREAGLIVIVTTISPFARDRKNAKARIGAAHFVEVYLSTSLEVCIQRDPKGLYLKLRTGKLQQMTGIDSPYEVPETPDLTIDTNVSSIENNVEIMMNFAGL